MDWILLAILAASLLYSYEAFAVMALVFAAYLVYDRRRLAQQLQDIHARLDQLGQTPEKENIAIPKAEAIPAVTQPSAESVSEPKLTTPQPKKVASPWGAEAESQW